MTTIPQSIIEQEIACSKNNIQQHYDAIAKDFMELGLARSSSDVKITIGPELEVTEVAGAEAHIKRKAHLAAAKLSGGINPKDDNYMPPDARVENLDPLFTSRLTPPERNHRVIVEHESNIFDSMGIEKTFCPTEGKYNEESIALNSIEFTSPPRTPVGAAIWINAMLEKAIKGARSLGLKYINTMASPHPQTLPNSIHLNSVIKVNGKNAFSRQNPFERGQPSELLLCVGLACRDYLRHSLFLFARAENDYERFNTLAGPSVLGMLPRREGGNFGFAMFRGEERKTQRLGNSVHDKPERGPLRFELRVAATGAAGHPNKSAYPSQVALSYEMIEAYMHILAQGVAIWKDRELAKQRGEKVPPLTEAMLLPGENDEFRYPKQKEEAFMQFQNNPQAQEYWGTRIPLLGQLSEELDALNIKDYALTTVEKGPHIKRGI